MWKIILYSFVQSTLLVAAQVFLKLAQNKMLSFGWNRGFWTSVFLNWQFAVCGLLFGGASILWMYIVKHYPLSTAYPMISLSYVFGLLAAMVVFHEEVSINKWIGVVFIVVGCCCVAK